MFSRFERPKGDEFTDKFGNIHNIGFENFDSKGSFGRDRPISQWRTDFYCICEQFNPKMYVMRVYCA